MSTILTGSAVEAAGYTAYFEAVGSTAGYVSLGTVEDSEDFVLNSIKHMEEFTASQFGRTPVDGVFTGYSTTLNLVLNEINLTSCLGLVYPESDAHDDPPAGGFVGELGTVGALASTIGGSIRLAPYFSSLPVYSPSASPVIHIDRCFIQDGHEIRRMLSARKHTIPLSIRVFPFLDDDDSDTPKLWKYVSTVTSA